MCKWDRYWLLIGWVSKRLEVKISILNYSFLLFYENNPTLLHIVDKASVFLTTCFSRIWLLRLSFSIFNFFIISFTYNLHILIQNDLILSFIPWRNAIRAAPTIGIPYGLNKNPKNNASMPKIVLFWINEAIAPITHNIMRKYSNTNIHIGILF